MIILVIILSIIWASFVGVAVYNIITALFDSQWDDVMAGLIYILVLMMVPTAGLVIMGL